MKVVSWNVNGIRACLGKGFKEFVKEKNPDILCLQEVKATYDQVNLVLDGYYFYWYAAEKKGYAGVAVFTKMKPLSVSKGIGLLDDEGRVLTLEFHDFYLVNVYTPNAKPDLSRLDFRYNQWDIQFLKHIQNLETKKPVIFCGDLNCAHEKIDIARPKENMTTEKRPGTAGFTNKERERFRTILDAGFIDTFRLLHPKKVQYSWWTYRFNARKNNIGWCIDYVGVSSQLKTKVKTAEIFDTVIGSDHCPIFMAIDV